jgi:IS5 family transposase
MKQQPLAMAADDNAQYELYRGPTRRDTFLATMEQIVPWATLCEVIEPHDPKAGNGRPPVGLERMLRMYLVQHWFNLADGACEDALLDSTSLRRFVGIDLGRERVPDADATTLLKCRHLLGLGAQRGRHRSQRARQAPAALRPWLQFPSTMCRLDTTVADLLAPKG